MGKTFIFNKERRGFYERMFRGINFLNFMIIELKKFGLTLTSRDDGREALAAFKPSLNNVSEHETIEIHFSGVNTFSPSWGDEFITPLFQIFGERLILVDMNNLSVQATINLLERIHKIEFNVA